MKSYTLKIRGGVSVDSYGKKAGKGALIQEEKSGTLGVSQDQYLFQPIVAFEPGIAMREGGHIYEDVSGTLRAKPGDNQMTVAYGLDSYNQSCEEEVSQTIRAADGGDTIPKVAYGFDGYNGATDERVSTLGVNCGMSTGRNGVICVENHPNDSRVKIDDSGSVQTLTSRMGTGGGNVPIIIFSKRRRAQNKDDFETWVESERTNTMNTFDMGDVRTTEVVVCISKEREIE